MKEYDFIFNVDLEDGQPAIKLPYNLSQDPWRAAQNFIHTRKLPIVYLEQVANFIIQNTAQAREERAVQVRVKYFLNITSRILRILVEHINSICSLESKLFLISICSIRTLGIFEVIAKTSF